MAKARLNAEQKPEIAVKRDLIRAGLMGFMGACLLVAGLLALTMPLPYADEVSYRIWIGGFGTVGGAALLIWGIRAFTVSRYVVQIDESGICDRSTWMSPGSISWDEVQSAYVLEMKSGSYLCFELTDAEAFKARLPRHKARLVRANQETGFAPVRIQFAAFTNMVSCDEAFAVVKALRPKICHGKKKLKAPAIKAHATSVSA